MSRKRYEQTTNYVPAYAPRITAQPAAAPTQGAGVFVAVVVVLLVILAVLMVGVFGLIGYTLHWPARVTALWTLVGWGGSALLALPWAINRVIPVVDDLLDGPGGSRGGDDR